MSAKPSNRRVKVYKMSNGEWDDQGTGYIECIMIEKFDAPGIVVKSEEDDLLILESKIDIRQDTYLRQQDTLIVWNEPLNDESLDLALSFQEASGCQEIWDEILEIQFTHGLSDMESFLKETSQEVDLPPANLANIDQIVSILSSCHSPGQKDALAKVVLYQQYLPKLMTLFRVAADLESQENLAKMFKITKFLFLLNNKALIEELLSDKNYLDVMEALESDPEINPSCRIHHADFLRNQAAFKEIISFKEQPQLLSRIHQTFRLTYVRDVALARSLDEGTFTTLSGMVQVNNNTVITHLANDKSWVESLLNIIKSSGESMLGDQLAFLSELCDMSQALEPKNKLSFHQSLISFGLFDILQRTLESEKASIRMTSITILLETVGYDTGLVRSFILEQKPNYTFFKLLISRLDQDPDSGVKNLLTDVIRSLLDEPNELDAIVAPKPQSLSLSFQEDKQKLLNLFYQDFFLLLFDPLLRPLPDGPHTESQILLKCNLCDLLGNFIEHHGPRIRHLILKQGVLKKILLLLKAKERFLAAAAVRILRKVVATNDPTFDNYITNENLFEPVVAAFLENGEKYNLFNSVVLDLFEFIANPKNARIVLVKYYAVNFHENLKNLSYPNPFNLLYVTYQSLKDYPEDNSQILSDSLREKGRRKFMEQRAEESWFDQDDEEDLPKKRGRDGHPESLVPYESPRKKLRPSDFT